MHKSEAGYSLGQGIVMGGLLVGVVLWIIGIVPVGSFITVPLGFLLMVVYK